MEVPFGYCHCGCNQKTSLASQTARTRNLVKGQPTDYIRGHKNRKSPVDYVIEDRGYKTPCWIWQLATDKDGYGQKKVKGKQAKAHRHFYERKYGPVPAGLEPDHLCRVRPCVNPDHLEPVSVAENSRRGSNAVLTAAEVREIRSLSFSHRGDRTRTAAKFGVNPATICDILKRKTWKDLT